MIINKVEAFITDEDRAYIAEQSDTIRIYNEQVAQLNLDVKKGVSIDELVKKSEEINQSLALIRKAYRDISNRERDIEDRYIASFNNNVEAVMVDATEILNAVEKADYIEDLNAFYKKCDIYANLVRGEEEREKEKKELYSVRKRGYKDCTLFLRRITRVQLNALHRIDEQATPGESKAVDQLLQLIDETASRYYKKPATQGDEQTTDELVTSQNDIIRTTRPQLYISPIDIATNTTFHHTGNIDDYTETKGGQLVFSKALQVITESKKRKPVTTMCGVIYDGATFDRPLDQYDRAVFNAVVAEIKAGNKSFSLKMLYKTLTGKTATRDRNLDDLKASLDKLRTTLVNIDYTNEIGNSIKETDAFTAKKNGKYYIRDTVLSIVEAVENLNGTETNGYIVKSTPPLLQYAEAKKQLASEPIEIMNLPVNSSRDNIALGVYLYNRIKAMTYQPKLSRDILLTSIIDIIQENKKARVRKDRVVDASRRIFEYWQKVGFIETFTEHKDRFTIACKKKN